jgi:hypothetical protein
MRIRLSSPVRPPPPPPPPSSASLLSVVVVVVVVVVVGFLILTTTTTTSTTQHLVSAIMKKAGTASSSGGSATGAGKQKPAVETSVVVGVFGTSCGVRKKQKRCRLRTTHTTPPTHPTTTHITITIRNPLKGNILSVVGVVLCNKYIITQGFSYTMILGACHFAFTWLGCHVMLQLGYFKYKPAALKNLLPVSLVRTCGGGMLPLTPQSSPAGIEH